MSIEKDGKISNLILSEDGRVAIGNIPQTTEEMTADRTKKDNIMIAKLYCFDVKVNPLNLTPLLHKFNHLFFVILIFATLILFVLF